RSCHPGKGALRMCLVGVYTIRGTCLAMLSFPGVTGAMLLFLDGRSDCGEMTVTVSGDSLRAHDQGDEAAEWLTTRLETPCRLVRMADDETRSVRHGE